MESFRVKGKETRELHQLYKKLEQDWHAFKESKPTTASLKPRAPAIATLKSIIQQGDISPRDLMFRLQRESPSSFPTEAWKNVMRTRVKDLAAQEILQERREAIESGKLKGRRLFQSTVEMEGESAANMGPHREVRSMSFPYSEDEHDGNESSGSKGLHGCTPGYSCSSSSSSSSSCLVGAFMDKVQEVKGVAHMVAPVAEIRVASGICRHGIGTRYAVFLGVFAVALLMVAILCMSLGRSFGGHDYDVILVPT